MEINILNTSIVLVCGAVGGFAFAAMTDLIKRKRAGVILEVNKKRYIGKEIIQIAGEYLTIDRKANKIYNIAPAEEQIVKIIKGKMKITPNMRIFTKN